MTEIGSSAFQLQTVAEQRKDIINGTTLIRRMGDELNDEEEQEIKEGKMPVYPRGMLKFELTMGDGTVLDAIEYRKVPGIILGETSLGAKLRVRNVRVLRGIRESLFIVITELINSDARTCEFRVFRISGRLPRSSTSCPLP
jgi:RecQ-mediated genome instability protein 1